VKKAFSCTEGTVSISVKQDHFLPMEKNASPVQSYVQDVHHSTAA